MAKSDYEQMAKDTSDEIANKSNTPKPKAQAEDVESEPPEEEAKEAEGIDSLAEAYAEELGGETCTPKDAAAYIKKNMTEFAQAFCDMVNTEASEGSSDGAEE